MSAPPDRVVWVGKRRSPGGTRLSGGQPSGGRVSGNGRRPGRPWDSPRGACAEANQLVVLVRGWLDEASVSVAEFHQKLTPDHFIGKPVPELRRLRDLLAGDALELDLVEAVADVCFAHEPVDRTARRLREAREL